MVRRIKVLLKHKDLGKARTIANVFESNSLDVYRVSKHGIYLKASEESLQKFFKCTFDKSNGNLNSFEIPENLDLDILAIYEPSKPIYFSTDVLQKKSKSIINENWSKGAIRAKNKQQYIDSR